MMSWDRGDIGVELHGALASADELASLGFALCFIMNVSEFGGIPAVKYHAQLGHLI